MNGSAPTSDYAGFLRTKRLTVAPAGQEVDPAAVNSRLFPWQRELVLWALKKGRCALLAGTGLGKALASDTLIITPTGTERIDRLKVGDRVIGRDGRPTRVIGVFPQGERLGYRLTFSDKSQIVCDEDHLWTVRTKKDKCQGRSWQTLRLAEMMARGIGEPGGERGRWFIPMVEPVQFDERELPLHPYVLGCLIGDGSLTQGTPVLTTADAEMVERLNQYLPGNMELVKKRYSLYEWAILRAGIDARNAHEKNPVREALDLLGLWGHRAESKFVPDAYKFAAADTRLWLIQGLLDTDGSVWTSHGETPVVEFSTASERLALDFLFLVQSIGGKGVIRQGKTQGLDRYRVTPSFPLGVKPFLLSRKACLYRDRVKYMPSRSLREVEAIGKTDMTCIAVDAPDGLFVAEGFIVTHNTFMQIEFARLTGERTLILAPLAVAQQTVREGEKLGVPITYARSQAQAAPTGLTITNYQMLGHFSPASFGCVVLDESSILKDETAATRAALIAAFAATPYRLAATATPCPNDIGEIANHAEFLGVMTRQEMLASFFINDDDGWRLKRHAVQPFYRWLASWAMSLENPADLGFPADGYDLPPLAIEPVFVDTDYVPPGRLFADRLQGVTETATVRRETLAARVSAAAALVAAEPTEAWIVWTGLNEESTQMTRALPGSVEVRGSDTLAAKIEKLTAFSEGRARILVTKAGIAGHGMNWQHCARMVFVGLGYSFEAYFQAIRRCWRFGQQRPVRVTIVLTELERGIFEVVLEKERQASELTRQLIAHVADYERAELAPTVADVDYEPGQPMRLPWWLEKE